MSIPSTANSLKTCLQIPQGYVFSDLLPTIAIALIALCPSETALKIAVLSAQFVAPNEAFSILQPVYTLFSSVKTAAPTLNLE